MNRSQINAFLKTVETGTLSKAADSLGYTQAAISQLLNSLESECGMQLLIRGRKGSRLTAEGELLFPYLQELSTAYRRVEQKLSEVQRQDAGLVRIGVFSSIMIHWMPSIMAAFQVDHPGIHLRLVDGSDRERERMLQSYDLDCNFDCFQEGLPYTFYPLQTESLMAVLPVDHPLCKKKRIGKGDLMAYPFIKLKDEDNRDVNEITRVFSRYGIHPDVVHAESNDYAVMAMVEHGLGISVLPELPLKDHHRNIETRPLGFPSERIIGIYVNNNTLMTDATSLFLDYVRNWFQE